jgi:integrase
MVELTAAYLKHCEGYYLGRFGEPTSTIYEITRVMDSVVQIYGTDPVKDFGPMALKAVRDIWIRDDKNLAVYTINKYTGRVRAMFKWGVENQLVDVSVYQAICCVPGLRRGRGIGRDTTPRQAVPVEHVEATIKHMPSPLRAIIRLLLLTGARPTEVLRLQRRDVDCTGPVWSAVIREHKLSYRGVVRTLYFGPRAQAILRPFLVRLDDDYLFSPIEAEKERHAAEREKSGGPGRRPNQKPNRKKSPRVIGYFYDATDLTRAIRRVCKANDIPVWTAYQLRHTACTTIEASSDPDTARAILGHADLNTTAIYLHRDAKAAVTYAAIHG